MITKIEVWDFCAPFRDGSYAMSHITQKAVYGRLLRVQTDDVFYGLGEIPLSPYLSDQERQRRASQEQNYLGPLIGKPIEALLKTAQELAATQGRWGGLASFALETVFLDLQARQNNHALVEELGGQKSESVDSYFSISERDGERIQQRLRLAGPERAVIQLKLGMGSLAEDAAHIKACLDRITSGQLLLADANGGWSVDEALQVITQFDDPRIYWEEPCKEYDSNIEVARESEQPVMVDQCVADPAMAQRAITDNIAAAICLKPPFASGLLAAQTLRDACVDAGMKLRIDGPWCGDISTAAILHLALSTPPELLISGCDLREPLLIEHDLGGVVACAGGHIAASPGAGLGIVLADGMLGESVAMYQ